MAVERPESVPGYHRALSTLQDALREIWARIRDVWERLYGSDRR